MTSTALRTVRPARPSWMLLAAAETRLILRNRTILLSATLVPLVFGLAIIQFDLQAVAGVPGAMAAMQLMSLQAFGIYMTATMALAARRQQLFLKRLRTSPARTASIVSGLSVPLVALVMVQTALVFAATGAATDTAPAQPALLAVGFLLSSVMMVGFAFLTAAFTSSPEAAQFTTLPGFMAFVAGTMWALTTPPAELGIAHMIVPGGAPTALTRAAWDGPSDWTTEIGLTLIAGAIVTTAVCMLAARLFRWQPRG
ncbi:ABC transporter permease [Glycomyces salinus]|uniref:ABC transporter permease n=1 Tax=Glycomyces salinus TaxID=980294 RepID=UPI0018EB3AAC|nr:ABC transporter permease [Glycomyces salinus]